MEPEDRSPLSATPATNSAASEPNPADAVPLEEPYRGLHWIFFGPRELRAGWSVVMLFLLFFLFSAAFYVVANRFHWLGRQDEFTAISLIAEEGGSLLALMGAAAAMGLLEHRSIMAYNLSGPGRPRHFFFGLATGFLALSALAGALAAGGWLHIGQGALSGAAILRFALLWGCAFLIVGCFEEGFCRCYLLFTLARGINFWWALGLVATMCAYQAVFVRGTASWGVYAAALLGIVPCCVLHQKVAVRGAGFWCAAWVTSTLFGFVHVGNPGEAWIGIFAAAFIGFVFCVSVRVTGSAWWAIGCHAAWDWAETFFYGTADSGLKPHGSYLTSTPAGNPLWSGGTVGPEGSVLVLGVILLLLVIVLLYGRAGSRSQSAPAF